MYVKPTTTRNIGGVLDDSIRLYRAGFAKAWPLALGAQLLVAIPSFYFRLKLVGGGTPNTQAMLTMYQSPAFWLPYLVCAVAAIGFYNAITLQFAALFNGGATSEGPALAAGYRLLPRILLLVLAMSLCALGLALIGAVSFLTPVLARAVLGIAGVVLVVFLAGRVYLANTALVVDDLSVFKSIQSSWTLTRGHWWRGATIYTVILLIALVFYLIVGFAAGLITAGFGQNSATGAGLTQLVSVLGTSLVLPLISASLIAMYYDFKLRIEGADLANRVNALATG